MAKAIYSLKILLFRDQFPLRSAEKLFWSSVFIYNKYLRRSLVQRSPNPILAPNQDLELIKSLVMYSKIDKDVAEKALTKLLNHL